MSVHFIVTIVRTSNPKFNLIIKFMWNHNSLRPNIVVERSKALTVFARSNAGIVRSNTTQGMDFCIVCVYSAFVLFCVYVEALRLADPPSKGSYKVCRGLGN
jgi:hypothetical protein